MDGRDQILKKIRRGANAKIIVGIIFDVIFAFLALCMFVVMEDDGVDGVVIFLICLFLAMVTFGTVLIVLGAREKKDPYRHTVLKTNPDLLYQADELFRNIRYQDKYIIVSDRIIANARNLMQMAFLNEVFMIYIHTQSYNYVLTSKELVLATARDEIIIQVTGMKKEPLDELANRIFQLCPYARGGYTQDNLKYLEYMRNVWERAKMDQKMGIDPNQKYVQGAQQYGQNPADQNAAGGSESATENLVMPEPEKERQPYDPDTFWTGK